MDNFRKQRGIIKMKTKFGEKMCSSKTKKN